MPKTIPRQLAGSKALRRPIFWMIFGTVFFAVGLCAVCASLLVEMHKAAKERAADVATRMVAAIENDVERTIESVDVSLQGVIEGLKRPDIYQIAPDLRQLVLFDRASINRHLELILVTDAAGNIRLHSRNSILQPVNAADREYFQAHKNNDNAGVFIGRPEIGRLTGKLNVGISRRVSHVDGSFAGIVAASLKLQYFKDLFAKISLGAGSNITLSKMDGTILMRWPYDQKYMGLNLRNTELYKQLARARAGQFEAKAATDNVSRLIVYSQIGNLPLVVGVGQSTNVIYSPWQRYAVMLSASAAILLGIIAVLLIYLSREFKLRAGSEINLTAALKNMSQGLCMFDASQQLIICNEQYAKLYELTAEQTKPGTTFRNILEHRVSAGLVPEEYNKYINDQIEKISSDTPHQITTQLNDERYVSIIHQPMDSGGWVATHEDVTKKLRADQELTEAQQFLDSIVSNIPNAIVVKDVKTRQVVFTNAVYEAMVGLSKAELIGKTAFDIYPAEDAQRMDEFDRESLRDATGINVDDYEMITPLRGLQHITTKRIIVRDTRGSAKYLIIVIEDVTDRKKSEQQIFFMAKHDALTGLANRSAILQEMEDAVARQRRRGDPFSVLLLDLDRFKHVNDTLGHPAGDALLREVATRLKAFLRETDVLARLGGDEFAIIQAGGADQHEAARALAGRIVEVLTSPFNIDGNTVNVGASIGIALAPEHASDPQDLLKMADLALYCAKSAGRNCYRFYGAEMSIAASARHEIENELRHAIANDELVLHYQPIIESKTGKICGAEALIRWQHPTKGMIPPDQFIPLAEETGLITQIGEWVLHTACTEAANWPPDVKVAVNLSPVQFRKTNLPDVVMYALAQSGLPPERLELEITETALIESAAECLPVLRQFKNLGVSVALDDFGTGYSSLAQLTMFQFSKIKVDKSFTKNMIKSAECAAIISAVLTLAKSLNMATTAEGVETVEQYRILRAAGVTSLQGYLFKRPCPASEINFTGTYNARELENAA